MAPLAKFCSLERELVQGLVGTLRLTAGPAPPKRRSLRQRGFDRAIECIRYADLTTLDLAALCTVAGVSQRTLEYAFREHLGLSPAAFIRQLRLHALRRELLASRLGEASVTDVAYHLGFTQLGRLSGDYRRTFGELPSRTLARTLTDDVPPLWIDGIGSRSRADCSGSNALIRDPDNGGRRHLGFSPLAEWSRGHP